MFDANMRWIPKGVKFFAEVHYLDETHPLKQYNSSVFLCEMITQDHENPWVAFYHPEGSVCINDETSGYYNWIVYAGKPDGTDFINEDVKKDAMELLEKLNETSK